MSIVSTWMDIPSWEFQALVALLVLYVLVKDVIPKLTYFIRVGVFEFLLTPVPTIVVPLEEEQKDGKIVDKVELKCETKPNLIQCFDPATLQHLGDVVAMTKEEVDKACLAAKKAQVSWNQTSFAQRRLVLRTIQKYIVTHIEEICRVSAKDSGKPQVDALLGEVMTTCEKIRCINVNGEEWLQKSYRPVGPMMMHKTAYVEYVPYGVLGVIAPWNYPFHNLLNHVISGLFSGNAVVSKVSEHTSWSSAYFTRIVRAALIQHGHDPNVVQTITGFGDAGAALVASESVDKIIFTGSPAVGKLVMKGASQHLKPVVLELGGKDPMVFCNDVNIESVIPWAMRGCYQNGGQNCCGVERLFLYESIAQEFIDKIVPKVKALRQGVPCGNKNIDCGAMIMDAQMDIIQELVDDAVAKGATLHCGGKRNPDLHGQFYLPTVLSGIKSDMRISQEEVFGPLMCINIVPNDDDEKCIQMINNCPFGLGSSVYCKDQKRGMAIGERIRSGMFTVNDFGVNYLIQSLPFGGVKESGFGRFAGPEGLRACCLERSIVQDRIPFVRTSIPPPIDYPINENGLPFGSSLLQLFYNESWIAKIKSIFGLIKYGS